MVGMRWVFLAILVATATPAAAGGFYLTERFGGASYSGDLARFGAGAPRLQAGVGVVRGPWAIEVYGGGMDPDLFYIDCYGAECDSIAAAGPSLSFVEWGADLRRSWRVLRSTWTSWIGLDFVLHGGPRYLIAERALDGYRGLGLGGGATFDANFRVMSMFLDFSTDFVRLEGDGEAVTGRLPSIQIGMRLGWM